jgi:hypothetical protein
VIANGIVDEARVEVELAHCATDRARLRTPMLDIARGPGLPVEVREREGDLAFRCAARHVADGG